MSKLEITFTGGKTVIIPDTALAAQRKVNGHLIQSIKNLDAPPPPAPIVELPTSLKLKGLPGVKIAKDIISKLDNIADLDTYTKGDERKSIIAAVDERKEELTKS